jgi:hypothetical protein
MVSTQRAPMKKNVEGDGGVGGPGWPALVDVVNMALGMAEYATRIFVEKVPQHLHPSL